MITAFLGVLFMHLWYDFHAQGAFVGEYKSKSNFILCIHCLTYALALAIPMYFTNTLQYWTIPVLLVSHYLVDKWKCNLLKKKPNMPLKQQEQALIVDQAWHLLFMLVIFIKI